MSKSKYLTMQYLYKGRWTSYWYQLKETSSLEGVKSILEIGPGNKIVSDTLLKMKYKVKTMDFNKKNNPDFVGNIKSISKFLKESFDLILCCQILEHIPYQDFLKTLQNLNNFSKKYLIVTLPYTSKGTIKPYFKTNLFPFLKSRAFIKIFNFCPKKHITNKEHYWEIGEKGYKLEKVLRDISNSGFIIKKHYPIFENPYHYMIVCKKK